ncbi:unnamed protein product [Nippostrongylus brasiliensis]|uniref:Anoctamin n=1 Tax=Nippostrongylus brasiliensis TaxID=27835 RepID=A0A0N4XWA1_NIPBR|nr:unnamed protein product [Nippostrongylus brasiliensis]
MTGQKRRMACPRPVDDTSPSILAALVQLPSTSFTNSNFSSSAYPNCTCYDMEQLVADEYDVFLYCEPFPFQHSIFAQIIYIVLFSTTILLALIGNFTVMWEQLVDKSVSPPIEKIRPGTECCLEIMMLKCMIIHQALIGE